MKRLAILFMAGIVIVAIEVQSAFASGWNQPIQYDNVGCCQFLHGCASFCDDHLGIDWMVNASGRPVYAIGTGYDVDYFPSAASFGGCGVDGGALWIKHRKSDGSYFWALYGHIKNPVYTSLASGQTIPAGAQVCDVANYDPCCPSGPNCPHLHFGIWNGGSYPSGNWGYGTQRSFTDPVSFLQNTSPDVPPYHCAWVSNAPAMWAKPNAVLNGLFVNFRNDGSDYWLDARNVNNAHDVELCIVDGNGNRDVTQWLIPTAHNGVNWITSTGRIVGPSPSPTNPGIVGTFAFGGQVPNVASQDRPVWLRLFHQGNPMDDWPGVNIMIRVDADPPTPFTASVSPGTNNVNSFSFSWTPSTDARSGLSGYNWHVNGDGETFTTSTSVPTGARATVQGTNTLYVRAVDQVGNSVSAPSVTFTLTSSPCPGREISRSPCRQPGDPCLASNLQILPSMSTVQLQSGCAPVRDLLKPGTTYSLGFEYKTATSSDITIGLGSFAPATHSLGVVIGRSALPAGDRDWRTFWSAPFSVTADQLQQFGFLRLVPSAETAGELEIRNAQIVAYQ